MPLSMPPIIQEAINKHLLEGYRTHEVLKFVSNDKGNYYLTKAVKHNFYYIWFYNFTSQRVASLLKRIDHSRLTTLPDKFFAQLIDLLTQKEFTASLSSVEFNCFHSDWKKDGSLKISNPPTFVPVTPPPPAPVTCSSVLLSNNVTVPKGFGPIRIDVEIRPGEFYLDGKNIVCHLEQDKTYTDYPVVICVMTEPGPQEGTEYYYINAKLEVVKDVFSRKNYHMERWLSGNFAIDGRQMEYKLKEIKKILSN